MIEFPIISDEDEALSLLCYRPLSHRHNLQYSIIGFSFLMQLSGKSVLEAARLIERNRRAKQNLALVIIAVKQCLGVVRLVRDTSRLVDEGKYCTALRRMEEIEIQLANLGTIKFASFVLGWVSNMNDQILFSTREEMYGWLMDIRDVSYELGSAAIRRYSIVSAHAKGQSQTMANPLCRKSLVSLEILEQAAGAKYSNSVKMMKNPEENDGSGESVLPLTFSIAFILQFKGMCECEFELSEEEMLECVPGFLYNLTDAKAQAKEDEKLLENITSHCSPVYRAVHIFHSMDMLDDFYRWYVDNRLPMAELESMIMHDIEHLDVSGLLTCLLTLASGIAGFFIVESTLQHKIKHKSGILTYLELKEAWVRCLNSLSKFVLHHVQIISRPMHFFQVKEMLLALLRLGIDLDFDTQSIHLLFNKLAEKFGRVLCVAFNEKCKSILKDELFQPMVIQTKEEFMATVAPFNLANKAIDNMDVSLSESPQRPLQSARFTSFDDFICHRGHQSTIIFPHGYFSELTTLTSSNSFLDDDEQLLGQGGHDSIEFGFPLYMPFSKTVPNLCVEWMKTAAMMLAFSSYIEVMDLSLFVGKLSELGISAISNLISEQLHDISNSGHMFHVSQVSINCSYLARAPLAIKKAIRGCLSYALHMEVSERSNTTIKGYNSSNNTENHTLEKSGILIGLAKDARDSIVTLIIQKLDALLHGMIDFVNWVPLEASTTPHAYCEDVIAYLSITFEKLDGLREIDRNNMLLVCVKHLYSAMLNNLLGNDIAFVNSYSLNNLQVDVKAIERFAKMSLSSDVVKNAVTSISQLLNAALESQESVLLDEKKRRAKYPALDTNHLLQLYSKLKETAINECKGRRVLERLKAQGYETAVGNENPEMPPPLKESQSKKAKATRAIKNRLQKMKGYE